MLSTDTKGMASKDNAALRSNISLSMEQKGRKLLDYLTLPNPRLNCKSPDGGNTTTTTRFTLRTFPKAIWQWEDFGVSSVDAAYGGALKATLNRAYLLGDHSNIPGFPHREIWDEDSLEGLLILWNWRVVSDALAAAQQDIWEDPSREAIYMVRGGQAFNPGNGIKKPKTIDPTRKKRVLKGQQPPQPPQPPQPQQSRPLRPDWAGLRRLHDERENLKRTRKKPNNILPGDTKVSSKWKSSQIEIGTLESRPTKDWFKPIGQLYGYCFQAKARYGYVITDEELVAMRFDFEDPTVGPEKNGESRDALTTLFFKAIPWNDQSLTAGPNGEALTVNLALWLLYLAAARSGMTTQKIRDLKDDPSEKNFSDECSDSQTRARTTRRRGQETFPADPGTSFRSETFDIRNGLTGASIRDDYRGSSATPSEPRRKRNRDEAGKKEHTPKRRSTRPPKKRF